MITGKSKIARTLRVQWSWYVFILVAILGTIVFNFIPIIVNIIESLKNSSGRYIGLVNYKILFMDPLFRISIVNVVYMGILTLILNIPLAFLFANMLNRITKGKNIFKVSFLLPMIMSIVSVALIFKFIFSADPNGLMNIVLRSLGFQPLKWFSSPQTARETVVIMNTWKNLGYNVILFFAGLQNIPAELYEAASIDGGNEYHKLRYITLPSSRNTFIFVYITTTINVLKKFSDVYAISGQYGDPGNSLLTVILYIYRKSFATTTHTDVGVGSAASVVLLIIILIITAINLRVSEKKE
ncbi:carbohydrate ABC transporter permease [Breznakiella homolactica]|uniref:Sugar ABC transporter permease n=1 Tax=Breznakiella homolactica TaxID=2798577 RepID=A0A7T7XKV1_9SPIR|nr:sugar ABC transporter permease [Breznakiella homolactica]QQO08127.1 sugar ABC transporter permease [Breznakiella homolactica]